MREIFEEFFDFLNVVGVIDCIYVMIKVFIDSRVDYFS